MSGKISDPSKFPKSRRLLKHADFQRVYQAGRRQFTGNMTVFFLRREAALAGEPRVGLTVGKVLGGAVDRNRIKRRMREAVRLSVASLTRDVDVVLHPRRTVLTAEFAGLQEEVSRIFATVQKSRDKAAPAGLRPTDA